MESVWDYPRPPALEPATKRVRVEHGGWITSDIKGPFKGGPGTAGW